MVKQLNGKTLWGGSVDVWQKLLLCVNAANHMTSTNTETCLAGLLAIINHGNICYKRQSKRRQYTLLLLPYIASLR